MTDDLGGHALHLLVIVLQQVHQADDAAELLHRHADTLARAHLAKDLQRADLRATAATHPNNSIPFDQKLPTDAHATCQSIPVLL